MNKKITIFVINFFIIFQFTFGQFALASAPAPKCENLFIQNPTQLISNEKNINENNGLILNPDLITEIVTKKFSDEQVDSIKQLLPFADKLKEYGLRANMYGKFVNQAHNIINFKRDLSAEQLIFNLYLGLKDKAVDLVKTRLSNFEIAYYKLVSHFHGSDINRQNISESELNKLKKVFAQEYEYYLTMMGILKKYAELDKSNVNESNDTNSISSMAKYVLNNLGINELLKSQDIQRVGGAPDIRIIEQMAYQDTYIREAKAAYKAREQFVHGILVLVGTVLVQKSFQTWLLNQNNRIVKAIFSTLILNKFDQISINRNSSYILPFKNKIIEILNDKEHETEIYNSFRKIATETGHEANFLETFARLTIYTEIWLKIKSIAKSKSEEATVNFGQTGASNDATYIFYQKMLAAEASAIKKKPLSLFQTTSLIDYLSRGLIIAIASTSGVVALTDYTFDELADDLKKKIFGEEPKIKTPVIKDNKKNDKEKNDDFTNDLDSYDIVKIAKKSVILYKIISSMIMDIENFYDSMEKSIENNSIDNNSTSGKGVDSDSKK